MTSNSAHITNVILDIRVPLSIFTDLLHKNAPHAPDDSWLTDKLFARFIRYQNSGSGLFSVTAMSTIQAGDHDIFKMKLVTSVIDLMCSIAHDTSGMTLHRTRVYPDFVNFTAFGPLASTLGNAIVTRPELVSGKPVPWTIVAAIMRHCTYKTLQTLFATNSISPIMHNPNGTVSISKAMLDLITTDQNPWQQRKVYSLCTLFDNNPNLVNLLVQHRIRLRTGRMPQIYMHHVAVVALLGYKMKQGFKPMQMLLTCENTDISNVRLPIGTRPNVCEDSMRLILKHKTFDLHKMTVDTDWLPHELTRWNPSGGQIRW